MIPSDLVRVRRRGEKLSLVGLTEAERARVDSLGEDLVQIAESLVGATYDEVLEALGEVPRDAKEEKLYLGVRKLVLDECDFGDESELDSVSLRKDLFLRAAELRSDGVRVAEAKTRALSEIAAKYGREISELEAALFSDLPGAARLAKVRASKARLAERYEIACLKGILLRATELEVSVKMGDAAAVREFFRALKFRNLLFVAERLGEREFLLKVSGPFGMFEGSTKYGLKFAQLVNVLLGVEVSALKADLRWGKERKKLSFETKLATARGVSDAAPNLRDELVQLKSAVERIAPKVRVDIAEELLAVPGAGVIVPDLVFRFASGEEVFLEMLGYHSRDAVFRRIEWAGEGAKRPILFAASSRLRVSEELLPAETGANLYVFKGVMSAREVLERVEKLRVLQSS